ncbi:MAG: LytR C-terminal domain-containing protein, partial [Ignavibacteriales bacterium]|nr:LytR C-terminal domain-containing protein [Ignavibacteriales bacterium]
MIEEHHEENQPNSNTPKSWNLVKRIISVVIIVLILVIGYFGYGYISRLSTKTSDDNVENKPLRVLQLDVLNGCGVKGIGAKFTDFLRTKGFDVVESKNYKLFQIPQTVVVARIGDLAAARCVASAFGLRENNIVYHINPDYFVDVS